MDKLQLAWPEAALPWCAAGHGRCVLAAACLAVSRYLATASLFDGTQLNGTPARRDIPHRPSNLAFVAVPRFKKKHISSTTDSTNPVTRTSQSDSPMVLSRLSPHPLL